MGKLKVGIVGVGARGYSLMNTEMTKMDDIEIVAICDEYADRAEKACETIKEKMGNLPKALTDYKELLAIEEIEAVVISTAWEAHVEVAVASMKAGKYTGIEVGGAYDVEDCWKLVRTYEETGVPCMLLENCCYGQIELMCLNMAKKGVLGELVHCEGAYRHDLREEISGGIENRHYRLRNYTLRNCDNYPTHQLGPICKLLNINRGNRMLSLVSVASKSAGLREYNIEKNGADSDLATRRYAQGDVVTTIIRCAGGETITLTMDTTLPRPYSRGFVVEGTKGSYEEANNSIFLHKDYDTYEGGEFDWRKNWDNAKKYAEEYEHPLWKKYLAEGVSVGHGGIDWLVLRAFFETAKAKLDPPIDVYDAAAWMAIGALSEQSVAMGGLPVAIPDFTCSKWIKTKPQNLLETYRLDTIPEIEA